MGTLEALDIKITANHAETLREIETNHQEIKTKIDNKTEELKTKIDEETEEVKTKIDEETDELKTKIDEETEEIKDKIDEKVGVKGKDGKPSTGIYLEIDNFNEKTDPIWDKTKILLDNFTNYSKKIFDNPMTYILFFGLTFIAINLSTASIVYLFKYAENYNSNWILFLLIILQFIPFIGPLLTLIGFLIFRFFFKK